MIINNNISFDTVNCQCCDQDPQAKVSKILFKYKPENSSIPHICRNHKGLLTIQVEKYMHERLRYKALAKQNPDRRREFENKSSVYKILINSVYGQMGHKFAKYENVKAAELVTRFGQLTIKECARIAKETMHWDIIYGDTDSLFINNSENINEFEIQQFIAECKSLAHVDIEVDKVYRTLLMSGSKNYLGITTDDKIIVKGLTGKKSSTCLWARNLFKQMLEDIKTEINPISKLQQAIIDLESGSLFTEQHASLFRFTQQLNKNPDEYKHRCVQKIIGKLENLQEGDVIHYFKSDLIDKTTNDKYTQDIRKASTREYKRQLISTVGQVLKLLGYNSKKELDNNSVNDNNKSNRRKKSMSNGIDPKELISLKDKRLCNFVTRSASLEESATKDDADSDG